MSGKPTTERNIPMTDDLNNERFALRVRELIADAVNALDPADREERIRYCRETGRHGVSVVCNPEDEVLEFRWGGRRLALAHNSELDSAGPLNAMFISEMPDVVPDDLGDGQ
jgi:hypothetical protein